MSDLFGGAVSDPTDALVEELWKTDGWPRDAAKDRALIAELQRQFPGLDLADEFSKFRTWLLAKGTGREVKSRGRFQRVRNWCSTAVRYDEARRVARAHRRTGRGRTVARPAASFGESRVLDRW